VPSNLLVLALLAGFCFVHKCDHYKFRAQMLDGYRLLFHCSVAGAAILMVARLLVCAAKIAPWFWTLKPLWNQVVDIPYFGTFALCLPLSYAGALVWNRFSKKDAETQRQEAVRVYGNAFTVLLQEAINQERMVSITLETRKWYAGYVAESPSLRPTETYFSILPILSGYRDKDTLEAKRSIAYDELYGAENVNPADFVVTLPIASVRTASLFDPDVYHDHFSELEARKTEVSLS
jgi:hypothetical protein